jgi:anti-anti-sigma factor
VTLDTRCVLLELTDVAYFDSVGVRLVFELEHRFAGQSIAFAIVRSADSNVRRVLELCGAERLLATFDDRQAALGTR